MKTRGGTIYQLKVTLRYSKPPIWRRFLVREGTNFQILHEILQNVMRWTNSHLYDFEFGGTIYTDLELEDDFSLRPAKDARSVTLRKLRLSKGSKLCYIYDFGDYWVHDVVVEGVVTEEAGQFYPVCIKGRGACPPEDCGGIPGYFDLLTALDDPGHPDHEQIIDWLGGEFDPETFDLEEINAILRVRYRGV